MSKKNSNTRRKLLIGLGSTVAGASQLPKSWSKPIVDSVILPAHAATSEDTDSSPTPTPPPPPPPLPTSFSGAITFSGVVNNHKENKLLSVLVPKVYAGVAAATSGEMCITVDSPGGSNFTAQVLVSDGRGTDAVFSGNGTINGGAAALSFSSGCNFVFGTPSLEVTGVTAAGASYTLDTSGGIASGVLPEGSACPSDAICEFDQPQ